MSEGTSIPSTGADPAGALSHLRVLDLSQVRAGPTCCRILADFGADVLKIEAPEGVNANAGMGGPRHGYDMQNLHRNKRSLTLNLKAPAGRDIFLRLAAQADVVVENFRPDVKARLGIGYDALRGVNKRIILASISGFGETGPYRTRAGFDQIAQGMGGLMSVTGLPGQGPVRAGTAVADSSSGIYAATGILIALAERERSGEGQWVQTSLLASQIALMDFQAARYLMDGHVPGQAGNDHPTTTPMGLVATADGFVNIGVSGEGQWHAFCGAIGRPELAAHPDYATQELRLAHRPALMAELAAVFRTRTSAVWLELLEAASVPAGPVYAMDEVFADPQVQHLGMAQPLEHPVRGRIHVVAQPVTLSRTPATLRSATPEAGAHTEAVLSALGFSGEDIARLRAEGVL
jgi:crotonobetainyl-CoA:carnitine CoA-transferase CaiB-like acyl-CoA transferase